MEKEPTRAKTWLEIQQESEEYQTWLHLKQEGVKDDNKKKR